MQSDFPTYMNMHTRFSRRRQHQLYYLVIISNSNVVDVAGKDTKNNVKKERGSLFSYCTMKVNCGDRGEKKGKKKKKGGGGGVERKTSNWNMSEA